MNIYCQFGFTLALLAISFSNLAYADDGPWRFDLNVDVTQLDNGMRLMHKARPQNKHAGIALVVDVGLQDFGCKQQAAPHLLEHMFFEGTAEYSANALRQRIQSKAGKINGFTTIEDTLYTIDIHEDYIGYGIEHLFHVLQQSSLDDGARLRAVRAVQSERGVSSKLFQKLVDNKKSISDQSVSRAYQGTVLECYDKADPEHISLQQLLSIRDEYYQPQNMTLIVLGNIDQEELNRVLEKTFSQLPGATSKVSQAMIDSSLKPVVTNESTVIEYSHPANVESEIFMVIPTIGYADKHVYLVDIITDYLDEQLFKKVRNEFGLGYTPYAYFESGVGYGHIRAYVQTTGVWAEKTESLFRDIYQDLLINGIPEKTLERLKARRILLLESEEKSTVRWLKDYRKRRFLQQLPDAKMQLQSIQVEEVNDLLRLSFPKQPTVGVLKPRSAKNSSLQIVMIILLSALLGAILIYLKRRFLSSSSRD